MGGQTEMVVLVLSSHERCIHDDGSLASPSESQTSILEAHSVSMSDLENQSEPLLAGLREAGSCIESLKLFAARLRRLVVTIVYSELWSTALAFVIAALVVGLYSLLRSSPRPHLFATTFPTRDETLDMAALSAIVYEFKHIDSSQVCPIINAGNYTPTKIAADGAPAGLRCHWYLHDESIGTQVMIAETAPNVLAIVFAGTDDLKTSLTDANLLTNVFGNDNLTLPDPRVRVHEGFNEAVFESHIFDQIVDHFDYHRRNHHKLYITGHSLGGANAILMAAGLLERRMVERREFHSVLPWRHAPELPDLTVITFGSPQMGNLYWKDYFHHSPHILRHMRIWRFVLGWDLVPRLPTGFYHVGHTIQLNRGSNNTDNATMQAYFEHYGDADHRLAGVPFGWSAKPFIWVPTSLTSHFVSRYYEFFRTWGESPWMDRFEVVQPDGSDDKLPNVDDDFWVNPPDDDL